MSIFLNSTFCGLFLLTFDWRYDITNLQKICSDSEEETFSDEPEGPGEGSSPEGSPQERKVGQAAAVNETNMRNKKDLCLMGVLPMLNFFK